MSRRSSPIKRKSLAEERPDLLAQWSKTNLLSPSDVSCGSHIKVRWVCEKGHEWNAIVKNRVLLGSGCPYCSHRAVLKGYNDLQTEYPEIAKSWSNKNHDSPYDLIISDLQMEEDFEPKYAGEWFIEQVRTFSKYFNTKIIICSGCYNIKQIAETLHTDYIPKRIAVSDINGYKDSIINNLK